MCFLSPLVISCCGIMVFYLQLVFFCYNVPYIPYFNARKAEER